MNRLSPSLHAGKVVFVFTPQCKTLSKGFQRRLNCVLSDLPVPLRPFQQLLVIHCAAYIYI